MQYLITFLEGIISFISPCMLPMLPIYVSYFAGGADKKEHMLRRAICFVLGFTAVFSLLGLFAGTLGAFLTKYQTVVNIVTGAIVIIFGLSYLELLNLPFFKGMGSFKKIDGAFGAFLFGIVYSVSLTPCVGAFLGSALMLASGSGTALQGLMLLLVYSLGLGIPFIFSAVLLDQLGGAFGFIKKHYGVINKICGGFLIIVGLAMMSGVLGSLLALFS
ncbi:MAG: sulfite exporter TauE/SafE family protein [Oscillospiraceae bacterium]|nr:sulfite exporter TauE/SafE family protein [Oscillospiraceae bacterium]